VCSCVHVWCFSYYFFTFIFKFIFKFSMSWNMCQIWNNYLIIIFRFNW
jgi:hypothetical protein